MAINYLNLNYQNDADKEALCVINTLAELENRKPHDSLRRLILEAGNKKIKELFIPLKNNSPSIEGNNFNESGKESQE